MITRYGTFEMPNGNVVKVEVVRQSKATGSLTVRLLEGKHKGSTLIIKPYEFNYQYSQFKPKTPAK